MLTFDELNSEIQAESISDNFEEYLKIYFEGKYSKKCVLGIDIYKYSKYEFVPQSLLPFLFEHLLHASIKQCINEEKFIFEKWKLDEFEHKFINTGDGGFIIFENPIEAIIFLSYFQANLHEFNTNNLNIYLKNIVKDITLRYCLTWDDVIHYSKNHYGPGIINNARILSKDTLNRCLIDSNCYNWFLENINGIENLININLDKLRLADDFKNNNTNLLLIEPANIIIHSKGNSFKNIILSKIGQIDIKNKMFDVYNLFIQLNLATDGPNPLKNDYFISIGNINSQGIRFS